MIYKTDLDVLIIFLQKGSETQSIWDTIDDILKIFKKSRNVILNFRALENWEDVSPSAIIKAKIFMLELGGNLLVSELPLKKDIINKKGQNNWRLLRESFTFFNSNQDAKNEFKKS